VQSQLKTHAHHDLVIHVAAHQRVRMAHHGGWEWA
jgi:hypothetical protein